MAKRMLFTAFVMALLPSAAGAQPPGRVVVTAAAPSERGYVDFNLGVQPTVTSFDVTNHPLTFVEPATVQTKYSVSSAREFDVGGGVFVLHGLAAGVSLSRFRKSDDSTVAAQVPHPFFFNRARTVSGTAPALTRVENAINLKAAATISAGAALRLTLSGGPTLFKITQDLVDDITINQTYPYDSATFNKAVVTNHSASGWGFNAGVDLTYLVTPHMGAGIAVGIARGKLDVGTDPAAALTLDAGGIRVGGGLRFRF